MHPIKLLAKMTPKTLNIGAVGGGTSLDSIDWTYAAHSLSGLNNEASNWAFYRYVGHENKERNIIRCLTMAVTLFVKIERFKIKPNTLDGIVRAAILEFTQPVCGTCDGTGWSKDKLGLKECPSCNGHGRKIMSNRERCRVIGMDHKGYKENSHDVVTKKVMNIISAWDQQIFKNVNEKMGEEEVA